MLYTDGIIEAENNQNQQFGRDRLNALIQQSERMAVKEVIQQIRLILEEFSEGKRLADDTTIAICEIT